ncbi:MAG: hypothetical protein EOP13_31830 [Pseudomonas sp.]|uniref:hypothetical protein n=1 Tax=Pseudomonas sp. TaxID=306 RepID=UPI0012208694|nr:hypothetical protein [Pseudomonas sp.]RZI65288.1 MAG: hypothetical protein EOP13_31830 [Pseudomonas sp.]
MQAINSTHPKIKALATRAMDFKESSDHCTGKTETWTEINFDTFARLMIEECIGVAGKNAQPSDPDLVSIDTLKSALRTHFGL